MEGRAASRRVLISAAGGVLLVLGVALMVLPGPGLLLVLAGVVLLTKEYRWAGRLYEPVRDRAIRGALASVATPVRTCCSLAITLVPVALGVVWSVVPDLPLGGFGTGSSMVLSGLLGFTLLLYSRRNRESLGETVDR